MFNITIIVGSIDHHWKPQRYQ